MLTIMPLPLMLTPPEAGEYVCGTESTSGIGAPGGAAVCASADDVYTYISGAASTDASPG